MTPDEARRCLMKPVSMRPPEMHGGFCALGCTRTAPKKENGKSASDTSLFECCGFRHPIQPQVIDR
jgi:hypothetical protein